MWQISYSRLIVLVTDVSAGGTLAPSIRRRGAGGAAVVDEEVAEEDDDGEDTESEDKPPAVISSWKARLQKQKEKEATKASPEEACSSEQSLSGGVEEVTPSKVRRKQSLSQLEVKVKEELRSKRKHDKPAPAGLF
jgi:hypothetical protein